MEYFFYCYCSRFFSAASGKVLSSATKSDGSIISATAGSTETIVCPAVWHYLLTYLNPAYYPKIVINYPDTSSENREEPALHLYSTTVAEDRVVIYERIF